MRWLVLFFGFGLVVGGLYLRWQEPAGGPLSVSEDSSTLRDTVYGPVIGGITKGGAQAWLGIPYADAPAGEYRWRAPRPPRPWRQPRTSTRFGEVCPQFASRLSDSGEEPGTLIGSEDCLSLNVFAPSGVDAKADLPVMVFIHGGGNTIGSGQTYDASAFAQEQGLVIVTINYRLGVLGWLSHEALRATARNAEDASGNFALLDMIAALGWVQQNIAAFGGDPGRVTLFGESAGGRNIYGLLASPLASGLFHGGIIQSGFPGTYRLARAENSQKDPQPGHEHSSHELIMAWFEGGGTRSRVELESAIEAYPAKEVLTYLRGLPLPAVMEPVTTARGMYSAPALFRDGTVIPLEPLPEVFAKATGWNRVPLLVGTNRDEMKLFMALSDQHVNQRFGFLPKVRDPENYHLLAGIHSDNWKATGVDLPLSVINGADPELPLFAYRFDWDDTRSSWLVDLPELLGAAHGLELDFLFEPIFSAKVPGVFHAGNDARRKSLAVSMRDYWAGFAYTGRPGSGRSAAQGPWPQWRADKPMLMILDESDDGGIRSEELSLSVDDIKVRVATEERLSARLRCALYVDMYLNNSGLDELFVSREYQDMGCGQFPAWSLVGMSR